ncbi:MAG: ABC transporter ATP-binding protein/permease [Thermosynechococcaceae cyanobacterium MS004]|nr:ABC transporter ATP-binding protein/permease [Thermosynechococcaceae cyanobacterium MS004]
MTIRRVSIWLLLWQMIRYAQRLYWVDTILWLLIAGLPALPGVLIREFFNSLTRQSAWAVSFWTWIALLLATGLARIVAIFTGRITKTQHRFTMNSLVQRNLLANLLEYPGAQSLVSQQGNQPISPGEAISFFRDDASQIEDTVVSTNEILGEGVFAVGSLMLLLSVNATITLVVFLPLALIAAILHRVSDRIKRYRRASRQATQQVTGMLGELFAAVQAIQVAGAETSVLAHLGKLCDHRRQSIVQDQLLTAILEASFENLVSLGTGAILLFAAQSMQSGTGSLTVGDFALFVYYLTYVTYFFGFLGGFITLSKQSEVSFDRMAGLANTDATALVAPHPLYLPSLTGRRAPLRSPQSLEAPRDYLQDLHARHLTYHYPGNDRGITDLSLHLQRGSFTVITGTVGSGKTTLLRVLLGLLPTQSGAIFWNGQQVTNPANFFVPPRSAYLPQVQQLFSTSLRDNIVLGLDQPDEALRWAIALACLERDLATLTDGLETQIGARGMRLSGGQIQRVATARMLIRQAELLVFDDVSSALDIETEQRLWSRLFELKASKSWTPTFLVVSHRRAVLERADHILLLNHGRVEGEGTLADLPAAYQ